MIHFVLKNELTWNNFCSNINNYMADEGYLLITTFDGDKLHKMFKKNDGNIKELYNEEGNKKTFFEFKSSYNYSSDNIDKIGLSYNAYVSMLKEDDNFDTEYLVTEKFLVNSLKEKCDMYLVEADSFHTIYEQQSNFFENIAPKEENSKSKNYFMKVSEYYNMEDSVNKASLEFSKLHKYYIFKKKLTNNKVTNTKEKVKDKKVVKTKKTSKKGGSKISKNNLISKYMNTGNTIDI